jgi:hypothetical protein
VCVSDRCHSVDWQKVVDALGNVIEWIFPIAKIMNIIKPVIDSISDLFKLYSFMLLPDIILGIGPRSAAKKGFFLASEGRDIICPPSIERAPAAWGSNCLGRGSNSHGRDGLSITHSQFCNLKIVM